MADERMSLYKQALAEAEKGADADQGLVFDLLRQASDQGDEQAAYALGNWYLHGEYVKRNFKKAVLFLRQAAKKNSPDALFDLANCYEAGKGVRKSERMAFMNYMKAALYGDEQSIFEVGRCYYYGIGIAKDRGIASIWLDLARERGVVD